MADGRIIEPLPSLGEEREKFREEFNHLDEKYKTIRNPDVYPVNLSPGLQDLKGSLEQELEAAEVGVDPGRYRPRDLGEN